MFPIIKHLDDILPHIKDSPEIGVYKSDYDTTVLCYAISDKDTFMGENAAFKRECRGITFDRFGNIAARPLHKFFNIGEKEETLPENIDWSLIDRVATKHDGSMITPLMLSGRLHTKTKRSFQSLEARRALEYLDQNPKHRQWVLAALDHGYTPVFEWVSPESPIVLTHYKEPELILLQMRDIYTGKYKSVDDFNSPFRSATNLIEEFRGENGIVSWDSLKEKMAFNVSEEGWILQDTRGNAYKAKTTWYFSVHHTCTFLRWRDMLTAARDDVLDDLRSAFTYSGRSHGVIDFVEDYVKERMQARLAEIHLVADQIAALLDAGMPIAKVVENWRSNPHFSPAMRIVRGSKVEESVRKDLFTELIPQWSLKVVDADYLQNWTLTHEEALLIAVDC